MSRYHDHEALPGHGYRVDGLAMRAEESAEHHRRQAGKVAAVVAEDPGATLWSLRQITWSVGRDNFHALDICSTLAQTARRREYVLQQH